MSAKKASVSVIIPTHRRDEMLLQSIVSLKAVNTLVGQIIVVDDDRDDVSKLARALCGHSGECQIVVVSRSQYSKRNSGAPAARNVGLRLAAGPYIQFLDDDDILCPSGLEARVNALEKEPALDFVVGRTVPFRDRPGDLGETPYPSDFGADDLAAFLAGNIPWMTSGPLWRRASIERIGGWNENVASGQDLELHIRALANSLAFAALEETAYYYRAFNEDKMSSDLRKKASIGRGDRTLGFAFAISSVAELNAFTPVRVSAAILHALELAIDCRRNGGGAPIAMRALHELHRHKLLRTSRYFEARLAVQLWFPLLGRYPSLSYLLRRFPLLRLHSGARLGALTERMRTQTSPHVELSPRAGPFAS